MEKHTPGPWFANEDDMIIYFDNIGGSQPNVFNDGEIGEEKALANLRLATAAPELLAALQRLVELEDFQPVNDQQANSICSVINKAKEAINKALGK